MRLPNFIIRPLWNKAFKVIGSREADMAIGSGVTEKDGIPYLLRWYIIPRNRWFNIYLHLFQDDDDPRGLHDHPWASLSILVEGTLIEYEQGHFRIHRDGAVVWRWAKHAHRLELEQGPVEKISAVTFFITFPKTRKWGFFLPRRWVPHDEAVVISNGRAYTKNLGD